MSDKKPDLIFLNMKFQEYCKMNQVVPEQIDSEKFELFRGAWFSGFVDGWICYQVEQERATKQ